MQKKGKLIAIAVLVILVAGAVIFAVLYGSRQAAGPSGTAGGANTGNAQIHLSENDTTASGGGISLDQKKVIINKGGTYYLDGELTDGQIYVKVGDEETVTLSLDGVTLSNKTDHPIHVENAKETILTSGTDAVNSITAGEGTSVNSNKDTQVAAIYSRDDLTVEKGKYNVTASGDGLHSNDDITIKGGDITIECGDDGVHANEELLVKDGSVTVKQSYEGLEANQITIEDGEHDITSSDDGLNANGGQNSFGGFGGGRQGGGGKPGFDRSDDSGEGRSGGTRPDTKDGFGGGIPGEDTNKQMSNSTQQNSDSTTQETEDESADEGEDDGTNTEKMPNLIISGGKLTVNAGGDGLDSNGNLIVKGGEIFVDGPTNDGNGALDVGTEMGGICQIESGTIIAVGSSGMAETFDDSSTQCSFRYNLESRFAENTEISILDEEGKEIFQYKTKKTGNSVIFSSPDLEKGKKYTLKVGDQTEEITLSDISSTFGTETRGMGGMGGRGGHGGGGKRLDGTMTYEKKEDETNSHVIKEA